MSQVRPLLAATRNDDELRKKEAELALIKERAERDQKEKEALETLKMSLEAEKRKVEDKLEAERALALDKDGLLERSKKRESDLEDEVAALQSDLDELDSQLDRVMKQKKEAEEKYASLMQAFDEAAEHLVRLEAEGKESATREAELNGLLDVAREEINTMRGQHDELKKMREESKSLVLQREEDLARAKERMDVAVKELEGKLLLEQRQRYDIHPTTILVISDQLIDMWLGILSRARTMTWKQIRGRLKNSLLRWRVRPQSIRR